MKLRLASIPLAVGLLLSSNSFAAPQQLLFVSNQDGDREIYTTDTTGKTLHQLTNNSSDDYLAHWSPDGTKIAFTSNRDNGNTEVYVMNADGSNQVNISNAKGFDGYAQWSPDGKHLVFCSDRSGLINLFVVDKDGKDLRQLTNTEVSVANPVWSPDGNWIAYFEFNKKQKSNVRLISADGTTIKKVTDFPKVEGTSIDWSPDSKKIVYDSRRKKTFNIYKYDLTTEKEQQLTNLYTTDTSPKWSANGKDIVFLSGRDGGRNQLYVMREDGSQPRNLSMPKVQDHDPSLSSDGRFISYTRTSESRYPNVFLTSTDGKTVVRLFSEKGYQSQPIFRPVVLPVTDNDS